MQDQPNTLERVKRQLLSGPIDLGLGLWVLGWRWIVTLAALYLAAELLSRMVH